MARKLEYPDAYWLVATRKAVKGDGFWFDGKYEFAEDENIQLLRDYRDKLCNAIFAGKKKRHFKRRQQAVEAMICNLFAAEGRIRRKARNPATLLHLNKNRWLSSELSYEHIVDIFRYFLRKRFIVIKKGWLDRITGEGKVTRMVPTEKFIKHIQTFFIYTQLDKFIKRNPDQLLILKDDDGNILPYKETAFTKDITNKIRKINEFNNGFAVTYLDSQSKDYYPVNTAIYSIHNGSFESSGRFYGSCNSYISMPRKVRRHLLINGERICELDFKALHIHLLYAKIGIQYSGEDPYTCVLPEFEIRPLLKEVLLCLVNDACTEKELIAHCEYRQLRRYVTINKYENNQAWNDAYKECKHNQRLLTKYNTSIAELVHSFKTTHKPISRFFHTGTWKEMQSIDSRIALDIMLTLTSNSIPCLPRHDSFITLASFSDFLENTMKSTYTDHIFKRFGHSNLTIPIEREI